MHGLGISLTALTVHPFLILNTHPSLLFYEGVFLLEVPSSCSPQRPYRWLFRWSQEMCGHLSLTGDRFHHWQPKNNYGERNKDSWTRCQSNEHSHHLYWLQKGWIVGTQGARKLSLLWFKRLGHCGVLIDALSLARIELQILHLLPHQIGEGPRGFAQCPHFWQKICLSASKRSKTWCHTISFQAFNYHQQ